MRIRRLDCGPQAETLDKQFEKPLRQHMENYRTVVTVSDPIIKNIMPISMRTSFRNVQIRTRGLYEKRVRSYVRPRWAT